MEDLLKALDNDDNAYLLDLSKTKIKQQKNDILQQVQFHGTTLKYLHEKLEDYRYICDAGSLRIGAYIRWMNLHKIGDTIVEKLLTNGAIICDWKLLDNGLHVICKTNNHKIIQIKFDENLIFQKLTQQEQVLLSVIQYIQH
jgi:hypothetical protein